MSAVLRLSPLAATAALLAVVCVFGVGSATAAPFTISFPTGFVCKNSALTVDGAGNDRLVTRTFGTVRTLIVGTGSDLVLYNPNHPDTRISLKGNGGVNWTTTNEADGTSTRTLTGHYIIFYFPTDMLIGNVPGPATLLVVGREVINIDAAGNYTQVSETGNVTDICALLPPD